MSINTTLSRGRYQLAPFSEEAPSKRREAMVLFLVCSEAKHQLHNDSLVSEQASLGFGLAWDGS